jgi:two-component system, OmpR family, phosphate regulon sensor histidine kinase PhoR
MKERAMDNAPERVGVLVVDDEPRIRDGLRRVLDPMGYRVIEAGLGRQALDLAASKEISIVLLDLQLPDMSGMEVLRTICREHAHLVVIIITGFGTVQTAAEAMRNGAYDLLPKPFEPDQLRNAVKRAGEKIFLEKEARLLQLDKQRSRADALLEKSRIHTIIDALPIGVMVTDAQGKVVLFNPTFIRYMGLPAETVPGLALAAYIKDEGLYNLILEFSQGCHIGTDDSPTYEFNFNQDRFLFARGRPVMDEQRRCLGAVATIVDITAMKVLDRLKREFVAKVSHELRSPLSTIHEQLAVVLSDLVGQVSPADEHLLSRAKEKTQGLIALIGDLLDLSRIESGIICEAPKAVHLDELLENIISFLNTKAAAKNQTLQLLRPTVPLPLVKADPLALESIFGNLITNAINYTPEGGKIEIRLQSSATHLQIDVCDTGLGIEARHLDKIFERFYRVRTPQTRHIDGTGLGLPIAKGLIDALGGRIDVASAPSQGSTFTVTLPLEKTH